MSSISFDSADAARRRRRLGTAIKESLRELLANFLRRTTAARRTTADELASDAGQETLAQPS